MPPIFIKKPDKSKVLAINRITENSETPINPNWSTHSHGYMSETAHTCMVGIVGEGEWIGQEILEKRPYILSCVSKTQVKLLKIKEGNLSKMNNELGNLLSKNVRSKIKWVKERLLYINDNTNIDRYDKNAYKLYESSCQLMKQYPQATKFAIKSFQKILKYYGDQVKIIISHSIDISLQHHQQETHR